MKNSLRAIPPSSSASVTRRLHGLSAVAATKRSHHADQPLGERHVTRGLYARETNPIDCCVTNLISAAVRAKHEIYVASNRHPWQAPHVVICSGTEGNRWIDVSISFTVDLTEDGCKQTDVWAGVKGRRLHPLPSREQDTVGECFTDRCLQPPQPQLPPPPARQHVVGPPPTTLRQLNVVKQVRAFRQPHCGLSLI